MAANVETMFYVREKPWHGLGTNVEEAPTSKEALIAAGLNWNVRSEDIHLRNGEIVEGYKANVRDTDRAVLGVVTDRYRVVQNRDRGGCPPQNFPCLERVMRPASTFLEISRLYISFRIFLKGVMSIS